MKFYHGTSIPNLRKILPPDQTGNLREAFRQKFRDCVFITPLKTSAEMYARKSAEKSGRQPIVYEVKPINLIRINAGQYVCDAARVIASYKLVTHVL